MANEYLFLLSYNREELSEPDLLEKFYQALKAELRTKTSWPEKQIGFRDIDVMQVGDDWEALLIEGLSTCRVFVPLMHPRYFSKRACGQEWFAFRLRQDVYSDWNPGTQPPSRIVPIVWSSEEALKDVLPEAAGAVQFKEKQLDERYTRLGLATLIRTDPEGASWKAVAARLAERIAEAAKSNAVLLPPLDPRTRFRELPSAWDSTEGALRIAGGWKLEVLCDRGQQASRFKDQLIAQLRDRRGAPQAYLVHGSKFEVPESLLQRLADVELSRQVALLRSRGAWLAEASASVAKQVPWPTGSNFQDLKDTLLQNLCERFGGVSINDRPSAADLLDLPDMKLRRLVTIRHEIWLKHNDATFDLIKWYLDDFWGNLPPGEDRPQIILLLAAIHDPERASAPPWPLSWLRRAPADLLQQQLDALGKCSSPQGCFRVSLAGLQPVQDTDIREWFREYAEDPGPRRLNEWVDAILAQGKNRGLPSDRANMDVVEQALGDMVHGRDGATKLILKRVA